jgi:hypothetical protein
MKVGDLVRSKRTGLLWLVVHICPVGNIGLWSDRIKRPGDLRWTYAAALEVISENR